MYANYLFAEYTFFFYKISEVRVTRYLVLYVMFCRSLFVLLSFFFWPSRCLSLFDLQILITPLVSSNSSKAVMINNSSIINKTFTCLGIQILIWDRHTTVVGLNRLVGFQPSPIDNWISNGNTYTLYKQAIKQLHRFASTPSLVGIRERKKCYW